MNERGIRVRRDQGRIKFSDLITHAQFAELLGKSTGRLTQMVHEGKHELPEPVRLGREVLWVRREAEAYARDHRPAAPATSTTD